MHKGINLQSYLRGSIFSMISMMMVMCMVLCIGTSAALAMIAIPPSDSEPDSFRPDWWDNADAKLIFDPIPARGTFGSGVAEGTQGFGYGYSALSFNIGGMVLDSLTVHLNNSERLDGHKNIWLAYHYDTSIQIPAIDDYLPGYITGYFSDGSVQNAVVVDGMRNEDTGWVYINALIDPQPASETFYLQIGQSNAVYEWDIDYLELATHCAHAPIPATCMLFVSGIIGILGLRRKLS